MMLKKLITRIANEQVFLKTLHADILRNEDVLVIAPRFLQYVKLHTTLTQLSNLSLTLTLLATNMANILAIIKKTMASQTPVNELDRMISSVKLSITDLLTKISYDENDINNDINNELLIKLLDCLQKIHENLNHPTTQQFNNLVDHFIVLNKDYVSALKVILLKNEKNDIKPQLANWLTLMDEVDIMPLLHSLQLKKRTVRSDIEFFSGKKIVTDLDELERILNQRSATKHTKLVDRIDRPVPICLTPSNLNDNQKNELHATPVLQGMKN